MIKFVLNYENNISVDLINDDDDLIIDTLVAMRDTHSQFASIEAGIRLPLNNDYFQMFYLEAINFPEDFFIEIMQFIEFLRQYTASMEQLAILAMAFKIMASLPFNLYTTAGLIRSLEDIIETLRPLNVITYDPATDTAYEIGQRVVKAFPSIRRVPRLWFFLDKAKLHYISISDLRLISDEDILRAIDYNKIGEYVLQVVEQNTISTQYFVIPIKLVDGKKINMVFMSLDGIII